MGRGARGGHPFGYPCEDQRLEEATLAGAGMSQAQCGLVGGYVLVNDSDDDGGQPHAELRLGGSIGSGDIELVVRGGGVLVGCGEGDIGDVRRPLGLTQSKIGMAQAHGGSRFRQRPIAIKKRVSLLRRLRRGGGMGGGHGVGDGSEGDKALAAIADRGRTGEGGGGIVGRILLHPGDGIRARLDPTS